jgi:predicted ribosomally synthesized peptide with SipW-like signal peptide
MKRGMVAKAAVSALVVALISALVGTTFASFSDTSQTQPSSFAAGTVILSDDDTGAAVVSMEAGKPGDTQVGCILIRYEGTLPARARLYAQVSGSLAPALQLTVTRGSDPSPSFNSCGGFVADATDYGGGGPGVMYSGPLGSYPASYAGGLPDPHPSGPETWTTSETHSYRFEIVFSGDATSQGDSATASFVWEARNS